MLSKAQVNDLAKKVVNRSMKIGRKPNPHYRRMVRKYPWMKGTFSLDSAARKLKKSKQKAEKFLDRYTDVDYGPLLIKQGKRYKVKKELGQVVNLSYHPENKELALAIRRECWKKGAFVIMFENKMEWNREFYQLLPLDSIYEFPKISKEVIENVDIRINLESRDWTAWSKGVQPKKIQARQAPIKKARAIEDKKKTPWVLVGWPFKISAKEKGISYKFLEKTMFESMFFSYSPEIKRLVKFYTKAFKNKKQIRITADDGTDLSFSLVGRRLNIDVADYDEESIKKGDVGKNLPTGEVFFAPVETSANGKIIFPKAVVPGEGVAENFELTFKEGLVVKSTAKKGKNFFKNFVKKNGKDSNRIAEFGIGLNKKSKFTRGEIIIDEKIFGSIHVAVGWNLGYGGKTNAATHLDFIKDLRNCNGKVFADKKLVIDKGKLVR